MSLLIFTFLFAALCFEEISAEWYYLHVKYALWDGYIRIPVTVKAASPEYVFVAHDKNLNVNLYSYPNDPRFFILFDTQGNIAGLRTGYIKRDVPTRAIANKKPFSYDYDLKPFFESGYYWNTHLWHTSVLFVSPDTLKSGGRSDPGGVMAVDVYLPLEGKWTLIPKDQCQVEALGFTKQGCQFGAGLHYFYQMKNTTACSNVSGHFLLFEKGQLIGLGFTTFGSFTSKLRTWFEDPSLSTVKTQIPNGPNCIDDWVTNYGLTTLHIFFKRHARLTFCMYPWQKTNQCPK